MKTCLLNCSKAAQDVKNLFRFEFESFGFSCVSLSLLTKNRTLAESQSRNQLARCIFTELAHSILKTDAFATQFNLLYVIKIEFKKRDYPNLTKIDGKFQHFHKLKQQSASFHGSDTKISKCIHNVES